MMQTIDSLSDPDLHRMWKIIQDIPDPEIPVISIGELGMVRDISKHSSGWLVKFTPTYSGCPATEMIMGDIKQRLNSEGFHNVQVEVQLEPAWTTDWMQDSSKRKLREYGIAPPDRKACMHTAINAQPQCPHCGSENTKLVSEFGSTACKAHFKCISCLEPFDYFKCI
ncbi:phenylacetic acid degradation protein [Vibrio galatheae]|uniref:Phenylacetic acid degradation protein n=1 Tax=Vibrio galatheae TaxID=579748 RepID=A0A0F4NIY9_9VIBR|nr:1,2-phenylacetyl-CoA epoxidase subunit PaaD [Vibrio galatheae]KJY82778.1 phenylacetic acid degradation protein [Vibrio galatheae]